MVHAARLPLTFTSCIPGTSKLTISVIAPSVISRLYSFFKVTGRRDTLGRRLLSLQLINVYTGKWGLREKKYKWKNTKKTASDTALVELCPGNALDTVDPSISINKWSICYCFLSRSFRSLFNFSNSNYNCFIHLFPFFFQNAFYLVPCSGDYGRQEITSHLTCT